MPSKTLHFPNQRLLSQLYCGKDTNIRRLEEAFDVQIVTRHDWVQVSGSNENIEKTEKLFDILNLARSQGLIIGDSDFFHVLNNIKSGLENELIETYQTPVQIKVKNRTIVPKTINQKRYVDFILKYDIVFGIGPAGTGKTYLAVAAAIRALANNEIKKIIISRPAVEAGEALGFLPGDLKEKILPYLRPIYDALDDIIGHEEASILLAKEIIEVAPLAYMRGRTLTDAFIILDEAQNTSTTQMLMILTRLGDRSRMIITGDITQVDLPYRRLSGLKEAVQALAGIEGIKLFYFENKDIIRHPLVEKIVAAYENYLTQ